MTDKIKQLVDQLLEQESPEVSEPDFGSRYTVDPRADELDQLESEVAHVIDQIGVHNRSFYHDWMITTRRFPTHVAVSVPSEDYRLVYAALRGHFGDRVRGRSAYAWPLDRVARVSIRVELP